MTGLASGGDRDRQLPKYGRWRWDDTAGELQYTCTSSNNPVDDFYKSLQREELKEQGAFGRRYKRYPNPGTAVAGEDGRGLYVRPLYKMVAGSRERPAAGNVVRLEDVMDVAARVVTQFYPLVHGSGWLCSQDDTGRLSSQDDTGRLSSQDDTGRLSPQDDTGRFSSQDDTVRLSSQDDTGRLSSQDDTGRLSFQDDTGRLSSQGDDGGLLRRLVAALLEYFHHFFQRREQEAAISRGEFNVLDKRSGRSRDRRMAACARTAGETYGQLILGLGVRYHHFDDSGTIGRSRGRAWTSLTRSDRQMYEALYDYLVQAVWITFRRPSVYVILDELGRLFRTPYFDFHRRRPQDDSCPKGRRKKPSTRPPFQRLLHVRSPILDAALAAEEPITDTDVIRANANNMRDNSTFEGTWGILGLPRGSFDDVLMPIDENREIKEKKLNFLGSLRSSQAKSRVLGIIDMLLSTAPDNTNIT